MEKTLVVLKPDTVARGLIGKIITRFEQVGLKIVASKTMMVSAEHANKHYPTSRREFIEGMGNKTLENYKSLGIDVLKEFGEDDPHKIGLEIQKWLVETLTSGPVFAIVLEGPHAVELVRKLVGHTLPLMAAPGTIRGDFSYDSSYLANTRRRPLKNLIHASGNLDEAEFEIKLWFKPEELHTYERVEEKAMQ